MLVERATIDAVGEDDAVDDVRRWMGCEYGSKAGERPIRLSTDKPSCRVFPFYVNSPQDTN